MEVGRVADCALATNGRRLRVVAPGPGAQHETAAWPGMQCASILAKSTTAAHTAIVALWRLRWMDAALLQSPRSLRPPRS
eukprot:7903355-Alexandrium_andersonii.AAC.1